MTATSQKVPLAFLGTVLALLTLLSISVQLRKAKSMDF